LTNLAVGSIAAEQLLCAQMTNTIVLLEGALVTSNEADRNSVSMLKGLVITQVFSLEVIKEGMAQGNHKKIF